METYEYTDTRRILARLLERFREMTITDEGIARLRAITVSCRAQRAGCGRPGY